MTHAIKCREVGQKSWAFLASKGSLNRLKIHACRFETKEKAQAVIDENKDDNPGWEWKVVPLS